MKSITAPRKTEKVLPQPVGAFTRPDLPCIICSHASSWKLNGRIPADSNQALTTLYPKVSCNDNVERILFSIYLQHLFQVVESVDFFNRFICAPPGYPRKTKGHSRFMPV